MELEARSLHPQDKFKPWVQVSEEDTTKYCLHICGGGHTATQKRKALWLVAGVFSLVPGKTVVLNSFGFGIEFRVKEKSDDPTESID